MISSDSTTLVCTWPATKEMLVVDVLGLDDRLPATRTSQVFATRIVEETRVVGLTMTPGQQVSGRSISQARAS